MASVPAPPELGSPPPPKAWLEILSAAALSSMAFVAVLALPIVGPFALPFAAVPIVRLAHRRRIRAALAASALASGCVVLLGASSLDLKEIATLAVFSAAATSLPTIFAGLTKRGLDVSRAYLALCACGLVLLVAGFLAHSAADTQMRQEINRKFDELVTLSTQQRPADTETAARVRATLEAAREFCERYWYGLAGAYWIISAAIAFYFGSWAGRPAPSAEAIRYETLRIPAGLAVLFVLSGSCWALGSPVLSRVAGNLLWPLAALYFLVGLSIICHFARRWFRARILRVGFYAVAVYVPINVGVALLGLFDWYADFRRRGREIEQS